MEPAALRALIATNIRSLAVRRRVSLNKLADLAGIQRSSFYRVLSGQQSMTTDRVAKLAAALGVAPHELLVAPPASTPHEPSENG